MSDFLEKPGVFLLGESSMQEKDKVKLRLRLIQVSRLDWGSLELVFKLSDIVAKGTIEYLRNNQLF